jgi:hypothetical protein
MCFAFQIANRPQGAQRAAAFSDPNFVTYMTDPGDPWKSTLESTGRRAANVGRSRVGTLLPLPQLRDYRGMPRRDLLLAQNEPPNQLYDCDRDGERHRKRHAERNYLSRHDFHDHAAAP